MAAVNDFIKNTDVIDAGNELAKASGSISSSILVKGSVGYGRDTVSFDPADFYKLTIATTGIATLNLSGLSDNLQLVLKNSDGANLKMSLTAGLASESVSYAVAPGTYYAYVYPDGYTPSAYALSIELPTASGHDVVGGVDLTDAGGSFAASSGSISASTVIQGSVGFGAGTSNYDSADFYKIIVGTTGTSEFRLTGLTDNLNMSLKDSTGSNLKLSLNPSATDEVISLNTPPGTYYLSVTPDGYTPSFYNLQVTLPGGQAPAQTGTGSTTGGTSSTTTPNTGETTASSDQAVTTHATFYTPTDMLNPYVWFGSVTVFSGTQWTATDSVYTGTYTGSNFQYGGSTGKKLISGTITGFQESKNGTLNLNITGLSADVATLNSSIYTSDALGADKYMYRGNDEINGSTGNDTIVGYDGSDQLYGNNGNDLLIGESGNDKLDGGSGLDVARYSAVSSGFSIAKNASGFSVADKSGVLGTDTLINIERLQFSDKKVALDVTDNALETLQFIGVIAPSLQGNLNVRGTILSLFDQGKSMQEMSQLALDAGLITSDNTALAKKVFKNVFNTTADPDQNLTNTLVSFIEQNGDAKFLATVAGLNINVDLVGLQQHGMEFI